jgi:hypothetical protein
MFVDVPVAAMRIIALKYPHFLLPMFLDWIPGPLPSIGCTKYSENAPLFVTYHAKRPNELTLSQ